MVCIIFLASLFFFAGNIKTVLGATAADACSGHAKCSGCSYTDNNGTKVSGKCLETYGILACVSDDRLSAYDCGTPAPSPEPKNTTPTPEPTTNKSNTTNDPEPTNTTNKTNNATTSNDNNTPVAPASTSAGTIEFANPIKASSMSELLGNVLSSLLSVVAYISIIIIIVGAVMYMLSSGDEKAIERAKKTITGAVVGLAIAAAAPTFLRQIRDILGGAGGANADDMINRAYTVKDIAMNILNFLLSVTGVIAIIGLVVGAVFYLTSYGDEERMEKGKKIVTASIIGIIIALSAIVIVRQAVTLISAQ